MGCGNNDQACSVARGLALADRYLAAQYCAGKYGTAPTWGIARFTGTGGYLSPFAGAPIGSGFDTDDVTIDTIRFDAPPILSFSGSDSRLYFTYGNSPTGTQDHRIRYINLNGTPPLTVKTLAGIKNPAGYGGDWLNVLTSSPGVAQFNNPLITPYGTVVYIADRDNFAVRAIHQ